mmetsp:Transcript_100938/g.284774  ORF Transcript_100938/g.284774 Transcript_100938/m.284774 type:complete len:324 (+) Transcript_100938:275-1246(+)
MTDQETPPPKAPRPKKSPKPPSFSPNAPLRSPAERGDGERSIMKSGGSSLDVGGSGEIEPEQRPRRPELRHCSGVSPNSRARKDEPVRRGGVRSPSSTTGDLDRQAPAPAIPFASAVDGADGADGVTMAAMRTARAGGTTVAGTAVVSLVAASFGAGAAPKQAPPQRPTAPASSSGALTQIRFAGGSSPSLMCDKLFSRSRVSSPPVNGCGGLRRRISRAGALGVGGTLEAEAVKLPVMSFLAARRGATLVLLTAPMTSSALAPYRRQLGGVVATNGGRKATPARPATHGPAPEVEAEDITRTFGHAMSRANIAARRRRPPPF